MVIQAGKISCAEGREPELRRRDFLTLIGGSAGALPLATHAQQAAMPIVGILDSSSASEYAPFLVAFREGLHEAGFIEGRNVAIEYRWAEGRYDRLPSLAAELVRIPVAVLVATGITAASAAKAATSTVPIVFNTGGDPVRFGLVASLNKPGGNVTGVASLGKVLVAKRFELFREVVPKANVVAFLVNPNNAVAALDTSDAQAAAATLGYKLIVVKASSAGEIDAAFATIAEQRGGGLLQQLDPFLQSRRDQLVELAARYALPAIYERRDFAMAGGLMSYGTSLRDALRLVGKYTGGLLKGEKPANLPVQQPTKFELVLNLRTAKALGLTVPPSLLATADEVIE
jgi:putative tryptophan/tyrosine transport system substrate-binding protein